MIRLILCSLTSLAITLTLAHAGEWPRFHGPNGTGIGEGPLPKIDPNKPLWKVELPGRGNGSPIVVNGKVYLQSASTNGNSRMLLCINATSGKIEWTKNFPAAVGKTHSKNSLASGTPACDGERIYCQWWDGRGVSLHAYDLTGKELWQSPLGSYISQHGPGFSPMVYAGLVFVNVDDDKHAELVAFEARTGERKWIAPRKHYRASYSTPFVLQRPDKPTEILLGTSTAITSYAPGTGKVNWEYVIPWPGKQAPLRVVGCPLFTAGLFVMSCGDGGGSRYMVAVDPFGKKPVKVWELKKETPYVPCVLAKDDKLFWIGDKGLATCADLKTGKAVWTEKVFAGSDVTASPILVGDKILMVSEKGQVATMRAAGEFEELDRAPLKEKVYASPAIADGKVFIRGQSHLFCFGKN